MLPSEQTLQISQQIRKLARTEYQQFMTEAFARLDADGSGYLTESGAAGILTPEQFAKLDMDGDGRVLCDELVTRVMADLDLADEGGAGRLE